MVSEDEIGSKPRLNELVARVLELKVPGKLTVEMQAPSYISYAHYQNQALVGKNHGMAARATIESDPDDGEYILRVVLRCQGRDVSEPSFLTIQHSRSDDPPARISYKLDGDFLFEVREATPASFVVSILDGAEEISFGEIPTEIFPANLWAHHNQGSLASSALLLSTFIRPRDPQLDGLLTKARQLKSTYKNSRGGNFAPSTSGYQSNDEEVLAEVKALYEAVQSSGINYSNPPSSQDWNIGQLVRTTEDVLEGKVATCLDSTILFASLLENIGIRPVIAIIPGHAFIGFWTTSGSRRKFTSVVAPAEEAVALMRRDVPLLRFVETTLMCDRPEKESFETAVIEAENTILNSLTRYENVLAEIERARSQGLNVDPALLFRYEQESWRVVDVTTARLLGYRPLAAKIKIDGSSSLVEYSVDTPQIDLNISVEEARVGLGQDNSPARVRYWKSQLLDLTFNNPLLNMSRRRANQLRLFVPNGRLGEIEDFLQQNKGELKLLPAVQPGESVSTFIPLRQDGSAPAELEETLRGSFLQESALYFEGPRTTGPRPIEDLYKIGSTKARNLQKSSKNSLEETGINNLYMTFGSLRWKRKDSNKESDGYVISPLILLPVTLRPIDRGRMWAVALDDSNDVATNETLALKLLQEWDISIPALTEPAEDSAGIDIPGLIKAVQIALDEAKQSTWVVQQDASIGTYDFSTFHMWKDLNDNWERLSESPLVKHLIETDGTEAYLDPKASSDEITEEELDKELAKVPVPSDGTQLRAVIQSLRGESFIIQGPPGTGKSQTITNLLARNLQEGKKVLFMSEKPAALQVVKDRLDEIRLGSFVLDLHSKNTSADSIRSQLLAALDASPKVDKVGIEAEMFDFETATKSLTKYPERLHRVSEDHNHSVYTVRDTLLKVAPTDEMKLTRACLNYFKGENLLRFKSNMENLEDVGNQAGTASQNYWSFSNRQDGIDTGLRERLSPRVRTVVSDLQSISGDERATDALARMIELSQLEAVSALPDSIPSPENLQLLTQIESKQKLSHHIDLLGLLNSKTATGVTAGTGFGKVPIADLEAEYRTASEAKLFKKKKLETFASKLSGYWAGSVQIENLGTALQEAREIFDLSRRVADSSLGIPGLSLIEPSSLFDDGVLNERILAAGSLSQIATAFDSAEQSPVRSVLELSRDSRGAFLSLARGLSGLFSELRADENSVALWLAGQSFGQRLGSVIASWYEAEQDGKFLALSRWGSLLELVSDLKDQEQIDAYNQVLSGEIPFSDTPKAFDRARLSLLLNKLVDEHELLNFNSATQSANISKLRRSAEALRIYNRDTIASSVVQSRTFDPTAVAGRAGALRSEINKQRGRLPIRQLMKKYWETITEITPCVAASPDSVARFLDVNLAQFDLIVFDEASQLRVPNSIGALGRGKAAVIVGDSKQMPPTSFFAAGSSEDADDEAELSQPDVESILTMAEFSKLPSVMLKWHYRSQDEALIAFSNANYYQNELASFPSPAKKTGEDRAVMFTLVEGATYISGSKKKPVPQEGVEASETEEEVESGESNTNAREAQAVVDQIIALHAQYGPALNLGVVTMNESQRKKIVTLLDKQANSDLKPLLDSKITKDYVFVRPLEKVQGDERDIILISVGFAAVPDPKSPPTGMKLPLKFGPLTNAGSEKRLNVAVTRARQRVHVFCSFDPSLMKLTDTSSEGLKGLKEYLKFAASETNVLANGNQSNFEEPDRHRIDVARAIESLGYKVAQNVGLSNFKVDVAVEHPERVGEYLLAILLDGPSWQKRPAANDRDVLPVGILEKSMGWQGVERIWMPVWLKDPDGEKTRIKARIEEILSRSAHEPPPPTVLEVTDLPDLDDLILKTQAKEPETETIQINRTEIGLKIDDVKIFSEALKMLVTADKTMIQYTDHPEIKRVISELVATLTNVEGPVHPDRAVSYIAKCFGLSHVQTARAATILAAIPRSRFIRDDEGFIFPDGLTVGTFESWKRGNNGAPRDISLVSLTELGNAMVDLCERTHGMELEDLLRQTMLAFGPKTLSAPIRKRLELAIKFFQTRGLLILDGNHFVPKTQGSA